MYYIWIIASLHAGADDILEFFVNREFHRHAGMGSLESCRDFGPHVCAVSALKSSHLQSLLLHGCSVRRFLSRCRVSRCVSWRRIRIAVGCSVVSRRVVSR